MEDSTEAQMDRNSGSHSIRPSESGSGGGYGPSTRRTRHRVDAGEPRGCFTSTYAANPLHHQSSSSSSLTLGNSSRGFPQSLDYFTPMKMLTDFSVINEVNNAVHSISNNNNNNNNTTANNNNSQQKLLLREMLQKSQARNQQLQQQIKSGYEENIEIELNKIQSKPSQQLLRINGCKKRKLYQPVRNQDSNSPAFLDHNSNGSGMMMMMKEEDSEFISGDVPHANSNGNGTSGKPFISIDNNLDSYHSKKRERDGQEGEIPTTIGNNLAKSHPNLHSNLLQPTPPPPPYLQQWKDTFKSTLVNHISDLIDIQFNLLFSSNTPPTLNPNLPANLHASIQGQQHSSNPLQGQHEHNAPHLMNGGGANLSSKNHLSPTSNRYHHHHSSRYPGLAAAPVPPPQPHFSSALLALSQNYKTVMGDGGVGLRGGDRNSGSGGGMLAGSGNSDEYGDDSPLSLVMTPKKKRHKVTDTRLTPRAVSRLLDTPSFQNSSPPPNSSTTNNGNGNNNNNSTPSSVANFIIQQQQNTASDLATSVAITNPSLNESRHLFPTFNNSGPYNGIIRMMDSPPDFPHQRASSVHTTGGSDSETGGSYDGGLGGNPFGGQSLSGGSSSSTLTPMHLRKAKLMFFWVRYPSSAVLKMYFPDIKFNKNNTAQLVKWFSNFREFYYIQMEKYARTGLTEGVKNAEDLHVSCESELYRVLNLHYNRNNHIEVEVPTSFRYVVEQTLREFFKAIQSGKDSEQSWKKAIYKIIARLDDPVPDYFKSPNFLEQLE